jgi:hypothetical protein
MSDYRMKSTAEVLDALCAEVAKQARAKALKEAAAIAFARDRSIVYSSVVDIEARKIGNAILALNDKPNA